MEILLRRASALARACEQAAQTISEQFEVEHELYFSAHVTTGDDVKAIAAILQTKSEETMKGLDEILDLYSARTTIRTLAGHANAAHIAALLTERDSLLKPAERTLTAYVNRDRHETHNAANIAAQLVGIRARLATVTNDTVNDRVRVSKLSSENAETIRQRIATLQRRGRDLSEELARENLTKKITLPDTVVTILRKHRII